MGRENSCQRADDAWSFNEFNELREIHGGGGCFFRHQTISRRSKDLAELRSFSLLILKVASITIMIGGAIINATAFVGGNYLARYLSGDSAGQEKKRHDLAVEKYEKEYQKYQENRTKLLNWLPLMTGSKMKRNQICKTRTTHWNFIIRLIRIRWISKNLSFQTFTNRVFNKNRERRFTLELRPWRLNWRRVISYKMGLSKIYYSPNGFWKGLEAVKKLAQEAGVSEDVAKLWLMKQAIWQIYLPVPKNIEFWCDISKFNSLSWSSFPPSWSTSVRKL